jgi:glucose/arabinose dehydrogenase
VRSPLGLDFHPATGVPYVTNNERDGLGDGLVPDFLAAVGLSAGADPQFYGWPYAYLTPDNLDPRRTTASGASERPDLAAQTVMPGVLFESHSAALGIQFYPLTADGPAALAAPTSRFPARYRGDAFVAFRGSWNRDEGTGYKVVRIPFEEGRPAGYYEDFLTGFLVDPSGPTTWGRPVGLLVLPDGSLLLTEEANGRIYRISYRG